MDYPTQNTDFSNRTNSSREASLSLEDSEAVSAETAQTNIQTNSSAL